VAGLSKVAKGIIKDIEELGDYAFKNDKQMETFIARNPDAYEAAMKKHSKNNKGNKPADTGKKKRGAGASSRKKKQPESVSSIQRDATEIG